MGQPDQPASLRKGPYGGYKQSGFGRTGGLDGLHEFLQVKNIRIGMG